MSVCIFSLNYNRFETLKKGAGRSALKVSHGKVGAKRFATRGFEYTPFPHIREHKNRSESERFLIRLVRLVDGRQRCPYTKGFFLSCTDFSAFGRWAPEVPII